MQFDMKGFLSAKVEILQKGERGNVLSLNYVILHTYALR